MATKMEDFMTKYVISYNTGYIEAILYILLAKLMIRNSAHMPGAIGLFPTSEKFKMAPKMAA